MVRVHRNVAPCCDLQRFGLFRLGWCESTTGAMGREAQHRGCTGAPVYVGSPRLGVGLELSCFEVIVLCDEQLEQVGWPRSFAYVQHCLTNVTTWITHRILPGGCRSEPVWPERGNAEHRRFVGLHRWESRRCPTGTEGTKNWPVDPRGWFFLGMRKNDVGSTRMNCKQISTITSVLIHGYTG